MAEWLPAHTISHHLVLVAGRAIAEYSVLAGSIDHKIGWIATCWVHVRDGDILIRRYSCMRRHMFFKNRVELYRPAALVLNLDWRSGSI
eukprot:SAG31_NODE_17188_length_679_cov_17.886207_1_plen_89_part_00